jgi:Helix-turn-helix domain
VFTISQAARVAGVHRNTIRRYLDAGKLPGAYREDPRAPWQIPLSDLIAAGLRIRAAARAEPRTDPDRTTRQLERRIEALAADVQELTRRAQAAEALLAERGRRIEDLQRALTLLEARALEATPR